MTLADCAALGRQRTQHPDGLPGQRGSGSGLIGTAVPVVGRSAARRRRDPLGLATARRPSHVVRRRQWRDHRRPNLHPVLLEVPGVDGRNTATVTRQRVRHAPNRAEVVPSELLG